MHQNWPLGADSGWVKVKRRFYCNLNSRNTSY